MLINPWTTIAQIINFLILVALLKRFLYSPITKAMAKREQHIAKRLQAAAVKDEIAQQEAERYRQQQRELEAHQEELLVQIRAHVEAQRQTWIQQTQGEVDAIRTQWYEAVQREKQAFLQDLQHQAGQELARVTRQTLSALANTSLEEQIVEVFINRLHHLAPAERQMVDSVLSTTTGETNPGSTLFCVW
ncbi:MAG: hypothetical protein F6K19_39220 [Cyanothece sp. SIO1E1]|nr:hypothetical protein [Cyanothece sp. SIO1E1]